eukprot:CAMPEP_0118978906 /NCGR_PEP_ID=MMETSP1173-20130426/24774_1 /TAXON_ID=1034831 /ORGANISM="Rhizochromulina marina cf, Strain CCMP1243" /LENGTH=57 /DNA_ID=CAMNT_0006929139 /DNA_START=23 /DNA_END=192 /DNA_ORIENTATION=-
MELVTSLKQELDNQLTWHVNHPAEARQTGSPTAGALQEAVVRLLRSEDAYGMYQPGR